MKGLNGSMPHNLKPSIVIFKLAAFLNASPNDGPICNSVMICPTKLTVVSFMCYMCHILGCSIL